MSDPVDCRDVRKQLTVGPARISGVLEDHLEGCTACARFAARAGVARDLFREHRADVEPDHHFADRVVSRLHVAPAATLGWAAVRVLPVTLVLLAVLGWLAWQTAPDPGSLFVPSPTEDLLTWTLDQAGDGS